MFVTSLFWEYIDELKFMKKHYYIMNGNFIKIYIVIEENRKAKLEQIKLE